MNRTHHATTVHPTPTSVRPVTGSTASRPAHEGRGHDHRHDLPFSAAVGWGLVVGVANAAAPLAFWWLEASSVHALAIALIAAVYIGFAVADGRRHVIAAECAVAALFVIVPVAAVLPGRRLDRRRHHHRRHRCRRRLPLTPHRMSPRGRGGYVPICGAVPDVPPDP